MHPTIKKRTPRKNRRHHFVVGELATLRCNPNGKIIRSSIDVWDDERKRFVGYLRTGEVCIVLELINNDIEMMIPMENAHIIIPNGAAGWVWASMLEPVRKDGEA